MQISDCYRRWYRARLAPSVALLSRAGVTPTALTCLTAYTSVGYAFLLCAYGEYLWLWLAMGGVLALRAVLSSMNQMLSEEWNHETRMDTLLKELVEISGDVILLLPVALLPGTSYGALGALISLCAMSEAVGLAALVIGGNRRQDGPLNRAGRAVVLCLLGMFFAPQSPLEDDLKSFLWGLVVLAALTLANRTWKTLRDAS